MSSILIKNIGTLVTGDIENPLRDADSVYIDDGVVRQVGQAIDVPSDQVVDAGGITAIPGLIDSHSHPTFGDFTPAQNSLGWITHYLHGGVTALISAGELHLPGLSLPLPPQVALFPCPFSQALLEQSETVRRHSLRGDTASGAGSQRRRL